MPCIWPCMDPWGWSALLFESDDDTDVWIKLSSGMFLEVCTYFSWIYQIHNKKRVTLLIEGNKPLFFVTTYFSHFEIFSTSDLSTSTGVLRSVALGHQREAMGQGGAEFRSFDRFSGLVSWWPKKLGTAGNKNQQPQQKVIFSATFESFFGNVCVKDICQHKKLRFRIAVLRTKTFQNRRSLNGWFVSLDASGYESIAGWHLASKLSAGRSSKRFDQNCVCKGFYPELFWFPFLISQGLCFNDEAESPWFDVTVGIWLVVKSLRTDYLQVPWFSAEVSKRRTDFGASSFVMFPWIWCFQLREASTLVDTWCLGSCDTLWVGPMFFWPLTLFF